MASSNYVSSLKLEKELSKSQIAVNSPELLLSIIRTCLEHHLQLKVVLSETWIDGYSDTLMKAVVSAAARRCSCIIVHDIAVILLGLNFSLLAKNFAILHTVPNFEICDVIWWRHICVSKILICTILSTRSGLLFDILAVMIGYFIPLIYRKLWKMKKGAQLQNKIKFRKTKKMHFEIIIYKDPSSNLSLLAQTM